MQDFHSIKINSHRFHVENKKFGSGIGFDMNIGHDLMVQLGLAADFNRQLLQWDGTKVPMKETRCL